MSGVTHAGSTDVFPVQRPKHRGVAPARRGSVVAAKIETRKYQILCDLAAASGVSLSTYIRACLEDVIAEEVGEKSK